MEETKNHQKTKKKQRKKTWLSLSIGIGIVVVLSTGTVFAYQKKYEKKIYPGLSIAGIKIGGMNSVAALELLEKRFAQIEKDGLPFRYNDKEVTVETTVISIDDPDAAYDILSYDLNQAVEEAYQKGRSSTWTKNTGEQIGILLGQPAVNLGYFYNKEKIKEYLEQNFGSLEKPAVNASLDVDRKNNFIINPAAEGKIFDYDKGVAEMEEYVKKMNVQEVTLTMVTDEPEITEKNIENAKQLANEIVESAPYTLEENGEKFEISKSTLASWLDFSAKKKSPEQKNPTVGLKKEKVEKFLQKIAEKIDKPSKNGKYERKEDGTIAEIQASQTGRAVNMNESIEALEDQIIHEKTDHPRLVIQESEPDVKIDNLASLNITEKIGEGRSNFAGSPANRLHNIKLGANAVHGVLIKPDEEFSLMKTLGKIDISTGYKEELVIKGNENKTEKEAGGGLCQIGTTTFRAALNSGLPITARKNHSYTVSYYFPIGTDATIYDPAPDFRFKNDTGNYILIQTRIEKNDLVFEFWGKKDGRVAKQTTPETFAWVDPPPSKIIETDTLAPGEKKCTEKAHKGVQAKFDYTVTYADGTSKQETFHSKYKPWQEVCMVGKQKEEKPPTKEESTKKTNGNTNSNSNKNSSTNTN